MRILTRVVLGMIPIYLLYIVIRIRVFEGPTHSVLANRETTEGKFFPGVRFIT